MDICLVLTVVFTVSIAVVMYMLLLSASLREKREPDKSVETAKLGKIIIYIGLFTILITMGLIIGLQGCEADKVDAEISFVETTAVETIEPEETMHIKETEESEMPSEAPSAPVTDETVLEVDPDELEMLACVIYQEAGGNGSCDDCRRYVADVVLNRMESPEFPNTMYEVLTAKGQYGEFYWTGITWAERAKNPGEKHAVKRAYRIAEEVLSGQHSKLYGEGYIWQARHVQGTDGFWCCGHFYGR